METPQAIEASCKLAFELGQQQALRDYMLLTKEAGAWGDLARQTWGGMKSLGSGKTFAEGTRGIEGLEKAQLASGGTAGELASQAWKNVKEPWRRTYETYRAGKGRQSQVEMGQQHKAHLRDLNSQLRIAESQGSPVNAIKENIKNSKANYLTSKNTHAGQYGFVGEEASKNMATAARTKYWDIINQNKANLAAGGVAAGAGIYGTRALLGGGDTYNIQPVQPQVAPHQYYMNQMSNWWK